MDWRLQGLERYLRGVVLHRRAYRPASPSNDHDHCEFCSAKFMTVGGREVLTEGHTTTNGYRWICDQCFQDFRDQFEWHVDA